MPNRTRTHAFSVRLSDNEYRLLQKKLTASGLNKTDYFIRMLKGSIIKVYSFDKEVGSLYLELRKIGVNLNQIAMLANGGFLPNAENQIKNMSAVYNSTFFALKSFLEKPLINAYIIDVGEVI